MTSNIKTEVGYYIDLKLTEVGPDVIQRGYVPHTERTHHSLLPLGFEDKAIEVERIPLHLFEQWHLKNPEEPYDPLRAQYSAELYWIALNPKLDELLGFPMEKADKIEEAAQARENILRSQLDEKVKLIDEKVKLINQAREHCNQCERQIKEYENMSLWCRLKFLFTCKIS